MIQRWLSEAAKWNDFKVVDVRQHVVDLVATLKDSRNIHIPLHNGQSTNLGTTLKIVLEGNKPFNAELVTPGMAMAMDMSEDFQSKVVAALGSSPALLYTTLPPKKKSKGKGKAKAKSASVAPPGGLDKSSFWTQFLLPFLVTQDLPCV
jgi:hypothetical protein